MKPSATINKINKEDVKAEMKKIWRKKEVEAEPSSGADIGSGN